MTLIQKIKSYFKKYEFYSWKEFSWDDYNLKFRDLTDEMLLDIGSYIKHNLPESSQIGNDRHRLHEQKGIECKSLDELLPLIREIIAADFNQTSRESVENNWEFQYFLSQHKICKNTICISNGLRAKDGINGNCIYPLASVRKHKNSYFCWNHLGT
jgi:hypothetical protein